MLRQAWRPLVTTAIFGSAGYYFFFREKRTFELAVKTKDANGNAAMTTRVVPLLSKAQVDSRLAENAIYQSILRPGGIVWNYTTASVASNDPIEDANASQILARNDADPAAAVPGDLLFFSVMDGHSGPHTSRLLSRILIRAVASELELLAKDPERILPDRALLGKIKSLIRPSDSIAAHTDPKSVSFAIQNAFSKLDHELINAPLRVLAASLDRTMDKSTPVPDLSQHPLGLASMQPAVSGRAASISRFRLY
jgi:pyruvate dehydrogenase phosphatase